MILSLSDVTPLFILFFGDSFLAVLATPLDFFGDLTLNHTILFFFALTFFAFTMTSTSFLFSTSNCS